MTMKFSTITFLALLSIAHAADLGFLRGGSTDAEGGSLDQLACTFKGGTSQDQCDATESEDGSTCVWCSVSSYGVCVSGDIATKMKQSIPGMDCDDNDDDDAADDDKAPPVATDDDAAPSDDTVPDDYWNCIEKYKTSATCTAAGCAWCDNKGGYGVCMDETAAENAANSDWYTCTMASFEFSSASSSSSSSVSDPNDPTCIVATMSGDESSCKATMDSDGKPCDWCSFQGYDFCMNDDQAQMLEQYGASCGDRESDDNSGITTSIS